MATSFPDFTQLPLGNPAEKADLAAWAKLAGDSANVMWETPEGIPVKQLNGLVWGLAAAVAAVAGLLLAPTQALLGGFGVGDAVGGATGDRKSTRLNSSHT